MDRQFTILCSNCHNQILNHSFYQNSLNKFFMEPNSPHSLLDSSLKFFGKQSLAIYPKCEPSFLYDSQQFQISNRGNSGIGNNMLLNSFEYIRETAKMQAINRYNHILDEQFQIGSVISESEKDFNSEIYDDVPSDDQIFEESESYKNSEGREIINYFQNGPKKYDYSDYFSMDLAKCLQERDIPIFYVRGLLMIKDIKELKTKRRLKVQRYLQKRKTKTWHKKICYDCRQRVAGQRLRIKGKFIKKRTAMQILRISHPITMPELRQKLIKAMKGKTQAQIQQIIEQSSKYTIPYKKENIPKNQ